MNEDDWFNSDPRLRHWDSKGVTIVIHVTNTIREHIGSDEEWPDH